MIRISVKTPIKSRNYFSFSLRKRIGGGTIKSLNPVSVYRKLENRLSKALLTVSERVKINVLVDYGHGDTNEGKYDKNEALYALVCFMEDYLPKEFANDRYKKYMPKAG